MHHAVAADGRSTELSILDGKIEKVEQSEARDISLKVYAGKSSATISGSVLTRDAIHRLAGNALNMARLAPPDPYAGIADPDQLAKDIPDLDLAADDLPNAQGLERLAREAEAAALAVKGVSKSSGAGASASDSSVGIVMSNGFAQGYRRTGMGVSMSAIAGEGTAMQRDYDYASAIHFADLRSPESVGREAGERAVKRVELLRLRFQERLPIRAIAERWNEDAAKLHREYATAREEFRAALRTVAAFHQPTATGDELDDACRELLAIVG